MSEPIPTEPIAAEVLPATQPELFDESSLPIREDLVEMVRGRSFLKKGANDTARFSGKIVIRQMLSDEEKCEQVCLCLSMGLSPRLIGKRFSMSPRSVVNIRDAMEERGELASVSKRIRKQLDRFVELGLERMVEGVLTGEIHAGQLPIAVLAAIDKKGQLEAGVVPGTEITVGDAAESNVRAAWAALRRAREALAASDPEAGAKDAQVVDITTLPASQALPDTALDTAQAAGAVTPAAEPSASEATSPTTSAAQADGGGGGYDFAAPSR
jgi:hypothetical protein